MENFLSGAIMMGYFAAAAFFARYWQKSKDNLFKLFSASFVILGLERIVLLVVDSEKRPTIYLMRLLAFILIVVAILGKNKRADAP